MVNQTQYSQQLDTSWSNVAEPPRSIKYFKYLKVKDLVSCFCNTNISQAVINLNIMYSSAPLDLLQQSIICQKVVSGVRFYDAHPCSPPPSTHQLNRHVHPSERGSCYSIRLIVKHLQSSTYQRKKFSPVNTVTSGET